MDREYCLIFLIALVAGAMLMAWGWWPVGNVNVRSASRVEKITWRQIWLPVGPALAVASALCGWALLEPDPVPERIPLSVLVASTPFMALLLRAAVRAGWSLLVDAAEAGTATVGLLRPRIVSAPRLPQILNDRQLEAVLEHERAHARHRDPLRIWLAQIASDLQWPWPQSRQRLQRWLLALELARDEEARAAGIEGADLAEAIIASAQLGRITKFPAQASLGGPGEALRERIARLLDPPCADLARARLDSPMFALLLTSMLALVLGLIFGEQLVRSLFRIAS
jgi:hypothetical protein